jgi:hypothetical protein
MTFSSHSIKVSLPLLSPTPNTNSFFRFWHYCGLDLGLPAFEAGGLPLEPCLQSLLLWLFWRWGGSHKYFCPGLFVPKCSYFTFPAIARMTGVHHQAQLCSIEMESCKHFCPGCPEGILPISASCIDWD